MVRKLLIIFIFLNYSYVFSQDYFISDNLTKPFTFQSGETISSEKMNQNFDYIIKSINELAEINNLILQRSNILILFLTEDNYNADLGGRNGVNNKCYSDNNFLNAKKLSTCTNSVGFISVSESDTIQNLQNNYGISNNVPIISLNRVWVADNLNELTNQNLKNNLKDAFNYDVSSGVFPLSGGNGAANETCNNFTTSQWQNTATSYNMETLDTWWLGDNGNNKCSISAKLLCICY